MRYSIIRVFLVVVLTAVVLIAVFNLIRGWQSESRLSSRRTEAGKLAPNLNLLIDGDRTVTLENFHGRFLMLYFFSGSCHLCWKNLPDLWELQSDWSRRGMTLLMVDMDPEGIVSYSPDLPEGQEIYLARDGEQRATATFGVDLLPKTFLIDPEGRILDIFVGVHSFDLPAIRGRIEKHLEKSRED